MCGINGIYGSLPEADARERIRKMNQKLAHRGPDAEGVYRDETVVLGHRRLSIIDLSEESNQPMTDPTGRFTIVYNGEIYNYQELRKDLNETDFRTDGDTEVLLHGFIKWGINFIKSCNGMFAFAVWDRQQEELTLVRDRMGIKPLYYSRTNNHTLFSSEIRALLSSDMISRKLNRNVLGEYLRYGTVHGSNTIVDGIFMLQPGSVMTITKHEATVETYWHLARDIQSDVANLTYGDTVSLVRKKTGEAVKRRLISDVPMGAFLSGGIDSSCLVALASQEVDRLKTFTVTFDNAKFDESVYARQIADKYNTDHSELLLAPETMLQMMPNAVSAMDFPTGDGINTYMVSKLAKEAGITVVLSGLGGDEVFAGYDIFKRFYSLRDKAWVMHIPIFLRKLAGEILELSKPGLPSQKIKKVLTEDNLNLENVYQYNRELAPREVVSQLTNFGNSGMASVYNLVKEGVGVGTVGSLLPTLSKVSYAEITTYLNAVLLRDSDQMSMAHALELRVPFLDHELVEAVMAVPDKFKYPYTPKKLLVHAMGDLLPPEIVNRPKMGFSFPWDEWMRGDLREFCGDHITDLGRNDAFNAEAVSKRWNSFLKGDPHITWSRLWYLCILQAWMNENEIE